MIIPLIITEIQPSGVLTFAVIDLGNVKIPAPSIKFIINTVACEVVIRSIGLVLIISQLLSYRYFFLNESFGFNICGRRFINNKGKRTMKSFQSLNRYGTAGLTYGIPKLLSFTK